MDRIKKIPHYTVIATILLVMGGCMSTHSNYPELDKGDILLEQQKQKELADIQSKQKAEEKAARLAALEKRLGEVGRRIQAGGTELCAHMTIVRGGGCVYNFSILEGRRDLNASADGQAIYITEAMMHFAKTDEELAIVLGHEYAHNIMGHLKSRKTNMIIGKILGTVADIAASTQGVSTGSAFSKAGGEVAALSYSKEFEKEADYVGLYITALAGYDISNAPEFWRKMSTRDAQSIFDSASHPSNPERYLGLQKTVVEITRKQKNGAILVPDFKD